MYPLLFEKIHITPAFQGQAGAAIQGDWISMKGYAGCLILVHETRGASAVPTVLRIDKARNVAGLNQDATGVVLNNVWSCEDFPLAATATANVGGTAAATVGATDTYTKNAAGATTYSGSVTQSLNSITVIEIRAEELPDATFADYDCIQLEVVSSNGAHFLSADYILYGARYAEALTASTITD